MSKKLIFPKRVKTILALVLTCLIAITLTGCDSSNRKSTGDLNLESTYASNANHTVTVGELYDELRYYASDYVIDQTFNFVYEAEINTVKENTKKYEEKFKELILTEIYGTAEDDEIKELEDADKKIQQYIDSMYQKGYTLTKEQVEKKEFETIYPNYYLEVAKYVAAWNKLSEEFDVKEDGSIDFGEINDESYFTTNDIVNWYKSNYTNQGYVDALLVRFINSTEANNLLKKFGIKTENGRWYQIKLDEEKCNTKTGYDEYYDDYDVDKEALGGATPIEQLGKGKATALKIFAAMYNYVYPYRDQIDFTDVDLATIKSELGNSKKHLVYYTYIQRIIDADHNSEVSAEAELEEMKNLLLDYDSSLKDNEYVHMSKERLDNYSTSLATYLYDTLKTKPEEDETTYTQYTTSAKAYGSYYFMLFKLDQEEDKKLYEESEDEEGKTVYTFLDTEEAKELKETILNELFENKLDETYIHELEHERLEDVKLKIYDSAIESQFMYLSGSELAEHYEKTRKSNNNDIASVTYKDNTKNISVNDAYAYLEPLHGAQIASGLLFDKYIRGTKYYTDLEGDYDKYVETIEMMLYYFANDYYSSSGYPSTIGKYNFMKLYFKTSVVEDAVKNTLMLTDAKSAFISDFAAHGFANDTFYENLKTFANEDRKEYYSLTATTLKVYVDLDEDGKADENLNIEDATALLNAARNEIINSSESFANAVNTVVSQFSSSSRMNENTENPTTAEAKWASFREKGLILESTTIGEVTNTTTADEAISTRIETLYNEQPLDLVNVELGFTSAYLDDEVLQTENSVSLLLITAGALPYSAKYENEENEDLYKEISVVINDALQKLNVTYTENEINLEQVKVYVAEYVMFGDVYSLPTTTTTALDTYLLPLITKYTSSASQMLIINNVIGTMTFAENNEARNEFYAKYIEINKNSADSYEYDTTWWNTMYGGNN